MTHEYNKDLCEKTHKDIDKQLDALFGKHEALDNCLSKKFNQILGWIITTLLAVISSMAIILMTRPK